MACRNTSRANQARDKLLEEFPHANIDIELVDVGNMISVFKFCDAIKNNTPQLIIYSVMLEF
ncbi:unnamed protein product [Cunninghamella echinulata]